jgi:transposase-like protein
MLLSEDGKLEVDIARDRTGEFEPQFNPQRTEALRRARLWFRRS